MRDYTGKTIYVGIDVHKNTYSVTVLCDKTILKRDRLTASPSTLLDYLKKFRGCRIKSAYEAGFCGFHLHRALVNNGIENIVVHAASIEVSSRDFVKTDKRDSLKIASQLADGRLSCVYIPSEAREDKRHLTRLREQFVRQQHRVANQIKSLLHLHGMIEPYTAPRVTDKWLKQILDGEMEKNFRFSLSMLALTWRHYGIQLKSINKEIADQVGQDHWLEIIYCSCPGIGLTSARKMINELGDMSQFSNQEKLFSYVGLTPREHSSGEHVRQGHITRQGKSILRHILVEAAWTAVKKDPSLKKIFENLARRGKKRAIVAVARILLGRIRTCIKERRLYRMPDTEASEKVA